MASIIKDRQGNTYVISEPAEIRAEIKYHYTETFKRRNVNFELSSTNFKKEYESKEKIDATIYKNFDALPSKKELFLIIQSLSNNKVANPNGITYELIKHLNVKSRDIIR